MRGRRFATHVVAITFLLLMATVLFAVADTVPRVSTEELKARLGEPGLVILDVRSPHDWANSDMKILGAVRVSPGEVEQWAGNYSKDGALILYCA